MKKKPINTTADFIVFSTNDVNTFLTAEQKQQLVDICDSIGQKRTAAGLDQLRGIFVDEDSELFEYVYCYMIGKHLIVQQHEKQNKTKKNTTKTTNLNSESSAKPQYISPFAKAKTDK